MRSVTAAIAIEMMERTLRSGKRIEIPSLGIVIQPEQAIRAEIAALEDAFSRSVDKAERAELASLIGEKKLHLLLKGD